MNWNLHFARFQRLRTFLIYALVQWFLWCVVMKTKEQTLIQQHPDRFEKIAPLDAGFTRDALMAFLPLVVQKQLRAELELALKGPAGLTRAMDVLKTHGDVMGQFHRHEQESFWKHVNSFLGNCGVKPANRAPEPELFHEVA